MKSRMMWAGIVASGMYVGIIVLHVVYTWPRLICLDLNSLGDFLAGAFSPLAFLWLVLGYFQQGEELRQNNEALRLQAEELNNSVEQQEKLVLVTREQIQQQENWQKNEAERARHLISPVFKLFARSERSDGEFIVNFSLMNQGNLVRDVTVFGLRKVGEEGEQWCHVAQCGPDSPIAFDRTFKSIMEQVYHLQISFKYVNGEEGRVVFGVSYSGIRGEPPTFDFYKLEL